LKGAKALGPRQLAALRELVRWRDERAAAEDKAAFRIVGNEGLVGVARALPTTPEALTRVPTSDLPAVLARRYSDALLGAVRKATALPESELPAVERGRRPPRNPDLEARIERLKAVRNRVATELGVDPGILCGRGTLEAVARAAPKDRAGLAQVTELRRWQAEVLGDALLGAL
jgi:ribonuclease D